MISKEIPAILKIWPFDDDNITIVILIQQENERTHIGPNDEKYRMVVFKIWFECPTEMSISQLEYFGPWIL